MGQLTGMALLPAVEVSLAALAVGDDDRDLADEAARAAAVIDAADHSAPTLARFGPRLLAALEALNVEPADCIICRKPIPVKRRRSSATCSATCSDAYREARTRNREHIRRSTVSDITPEQELAMRRRARKCPLCDVRLTDRPGLPNSKHLDHIIPLCVGGTHTHGNARILCAACNLARPKDGSDYSGPVTLWAQGEIVVGRPDRRRNGQNANAATCRNGLHPWTADNIVTMGGQQRCKACLQATRRRTESKRRPMRPCRLCGTPAALPGSQHMCPACMESSARKAAELHAAGGLGWNEVAALVGYGSGEGARYAAKRIGYVPAPKAVEIKAERPCPECGKTRAPWARWCDQCTEAKAREAIWLYESGLSLRAVADRLGYNSMTTVSNLMKSAGVIEMRIGRPSRDFASL